MAEARSVRRILVGLDAHGRAAVEPGVRLAEKLSIDVSGLFVEDADLLSAAGLPFARLVGPTGSLTALDAATVERMLRALVVRGREELERAARARKLRSTFAVRRGRLLRELRAVATVGDLIVVSGPAIRRAAGPVVVAVDLETASLPIVETAIALARALAQPAVVVVPRGAEAQRARVAGALEGRSDTRLRAVPTLDREAVERALDEEGAGLLVLDARATWLDEAAADDLVRTVLCPVGLLAGEASREASS